MPNQETVRFSPPHADQPTKMSALNSPAPPGVLNPSVDALAINNAGVVVGDILVVDDIYSAGLYTGFVDTNGSFALISFQGLDTRVTGINNAGVLTGVYFLGGTEHGFVDAGGSFTTIDVPNASYTDVEGINDLGQVAGTYRDATGTHGFIATPVPEPASVTLLGAGVAAMGLVLARRRRVAP